MTRTRRRPIRTRSCIARAVGRKRSSHISDTCCSTNRHGLIANVCATAATGPAERDAAVLLLAASAPPSSTVGGDKNFDVHSFVTAVRDLAITPHVAQKIARSAIDARTTRHGGYAVSQRKRKLIEQAFGWMKTIGLLRKLRHRGGELVDWVVTFTATAFNLTRMRTLRATYLVTHRRAF